MLKTSRLSRALASAAVLAIMLPLQAAAHEPYQPPVGSTAYDSNTNTTQYVPSCSAASWATPKVKIHTANFNGNQTDMVDAIKDVNAQLANVGASSVGVDSTVVTSDGFHYTLYGDTTPTIHVGFLDLFDPSWLAATDNAWPCEHFITVDFTKSWNYKTPGDIGDKYYLDGHMDSTGKNYFFRISYQHELLHALGVAANDPDAHPDDVYSFLNYGERPWPDVSRGSQIRPLPYDVRQLRKMYPASGTRNEIAVLNTWFDKNTPDGKVTQQKMLCKPSVGPAYVATNLFADYCGNDSATTICPGDLLQVHYALANYSTADVNVASQLYFSLAPDDDWDANDKVSLTVTSYSVLAATAQNKYWGYAVPNGLTAGAKYYPIIRATATTPSGVTVRDSIPLRGTVTVGSHC